jgi:hypothetical protein
MTETLSAHRIYTQGGWWAPLGLFGPRPFFRGRSSRRSASENGGIFGGRILIRPASINKFLEAVVFLTASVNRFYEAVSLTASVNKK